MIHDILWMGGGQANNLLDMLATDSIRNTRGGVINGRDISAAGRDVIIASQAEQDDAAFQRRRISSTEQTILQHASSVEVGGNLTLDARRDMAVIGSSVSAEKNLSAKAGESLTLAAAANEEHDYSKGKKGGTKTTKQLDTVTQQSAELKAGGDLIAIAGTDLTLVASKISAGNEAYVHADNELNMLAAQDSSYSLYDMKKKGNWGSKKTQRDEVTDVKNVGSEIKTGGDLTLESGGDQLYQAAKLDSGGDIAIVSGGAVTFEAVKDLRQESHEKSKGDLAWTSAKGKGNTDETLRQTQMIAEGSVVIKAVDGLKIDIKQIDQHTVSQTIDVMVKADPQLAWLKEAEKRGDVDWRQVQEMHDSFKYSHSSLGQGAMLAIIIIVTVLTAGGASALAASAGSAVGAGSTMAAATAGVAATSTTAAVAATTAGLGNVIATASLTSLASTGVVSTINNKGKLGAAFKDTFSSNSLRNAAIGGLTAGVLNYADSNWFQNTGSATDGGAQVTTAGPVQNPGYSKQLLSWENAQQTVLRSGTHAVINSGISTAINGGSLKDNLGAALVSEGFDLAAAVGNKNVGDLADYLDVSPGSAQKILMHALVGGAFSVAKGGDFKTGALAGAAAEGLTAIATENLGQYLDSRFATDNQFKVATAQVIGIAAGSLVNGDPEIASWVAGNVERYNAELHKDAPKRLKDGFDTLHAQGKYLDLNAEDVLSDVQRIIDGEKDPSKLNPQVVSFLNQFPPAVLRELLYQPTQKEELIMLAIEMGFPSISGKGTATVKIGEKISKEAAEALEKKFGEALAKNPGATARALAEPVYKTTKEAKVAAEALGFKKVNETVHNGQAVFRKGRIILRGTLMAITEALGKWLTLLRHLAAGKLGVVHSILI